MTEITYLHLPIAVYHIDLCFIIVARYAYGAETFDKFCNTVKSVIIALSDVYLAIFIHLLRADIVSVRDA